MHTKNGSGSGTSRFLVMPDDGMDAIVAPLRAATHTIDIYVFTLGNRAILEALGEAVARGVVVRAIAEIHPGGNKQAGEANRKVLEELGVQVHQTPPYFDRVHAKSYVVDSSQALVSTINYLQDWQHTRDYGLITGDVQVIKTVSDTFSADWREDRDQLSTQPPLPVVLSPNNSRATILQLIAQAQASLTVEEEQITDPEIISALTARSLAGVEVCVIANPAQAKNLGPLAQLSLQAPRARILYSTDLWMHAKLIIVDGSRMLMGSANLIELSLDKRREVSLFISDGAAVARAMSAVQQDIAAASPEVPSPREMPARPADSPEHGAEA